MTVTGARLSPTLLEAQGRWQEVQLRAPSGEQQRQRGRQLALSLIELGEDLESIERHLLRWRFHPTQTLEPQADGSVMVRFQATGLLELSWHLFTWGDRVRVIRPDALRQTLVGELERALQAHRADDGAPPCG